MEHITARMGAATLKPDQPKHSNLYVSGLGPSLSTEADLTELFAPYGHVETVRIVRNSRDTKSFAFVKMSTVSESLAAITGLNKKQVGGIVLEVKTADAGEAGRHSSAAWRNHV
jgi:RNA recognition motif-containing protein